jgi:hypothetical protein
VAELVHALQSVTQSMGSGLGMSILLTRCLDGRREARCKAPIRTDLTSNVELADNLAWASNEHALDRAVGDAVHGLGNGTSHTFARRACIHQAHDRPQDIA